MSVQIGQIVQTNNGPVTIMEKHAGQMVTVIFHEPPYSTSIVHTSNLLKGYVANKPNKPTMHTKTKSTAYSIWQRMRSMRPARYTICNEWTDFAVFSEWYSDQIKPGADFKWIFSHKLFDPANRYYGPETCHVVPSPLAKAILIGKGNSLGVLQSADYYRDWISHKLYKKIVSTDWLKYHTKRRHRT